MADGDFTLADLAGSFSLSGGETAGPAYGGGYTLGPATTTGFDFQVPDLAQPEPSAFADLARAARDVGGAVGRGVSGVLEPVAAIAKPLLPLAQLGTAGMGIAGGIQGARTAAEQGRLARGAQRLQRETAAATQAAAAPLTQFGTRQLEAAEAGRIPAAIQARIEEWKQGAKAQARDYAARSGQGDSQMLAEWLAWIDQQGKAMEASYLQEEQRLGVQGLQAGAGTLAQAGSQAGGLLQGAQIEGASMTDLMRQANEVLARLSAAAA